MEKPFKGLLIVLSGPSGTGKDTVIRKLLSRKPDLALSISFTTRKPRKGEVNGKDYWFVSKNEFTEMVENGSMLEYAEYCGNYYGTPCLKVKELIEKGIDVILEIEVNGGVQVRKKCPDAASIFILPPSVRDLALRLGGRGLDSLADIQKRLVKAEKEIKMCDQYDYAVVNDSLDKCVDNIIKIIDSEHMRVKRRSHIIKEVLKNEEAVY